MREFGAAAPGQPLPTGTIRHTLHEITVAFDTIANCALSYNFHTRPGDEIQDAIRPTLEPPLKPAETEHHLVVV